MVIVVAMRTNDFEHEAASGTTLCAALDALTLQRTQDGKKAYSQMGASWIPAGRATFQDTALSPLGLSSLCHGALTH